MAYTPDIRTPHRFGNKVPIVNSIFKRQNGMEVRYTKGPKKGELVVLNARQQLQANNAQRICNSLGYEVNMTSLTAIIADVSEQKFYEIPFAQYLPVRIGQGAFSSNLLTYRSFQIGGAFEEGIVNTGSNNGRLATADAGVDSLSINVENWGKTMGWTIFDLELAARSGNWDLIAAKEQARITNWQLGIQRIAFLGANAGTNATCLGLLNQAGITTDLVTIPKFIKAMNTAELKAFQENILTQYRINCADTVWPNRFLIPENDFTGLASQASPDFPMKSTLQLLEEAFILITQRKDFKILPLAYAQPGSPYSISSNFTYVLMNYDSQSVRMDIPVDYTTTVPNSLDNYQFQCVGYGQFTGVLAYRPLEMMYFTHT